MLYSKHFTFYKNNILILLFLLVFLLCITNNVLSAERVTFIVDSQGNDISVGCSAVIATADYQYLKYFKGSSAGLNGNLDPGVYIAIVKVNQQSLLPILPVQVEFTVNEGQECVVEAELKGMGKPMEMASQMMKISEFISQVEGLPADITILPDENNMGESMSDIDVETEDIRGDGIDTKNDENEIPDLPTESELGIKLKVNSELVVTVKKGNVRVVDNEGDYMLKGILNDMGYTYAGFDDFTGEKGCQVNEGESKKFANVTPAGY